MRGMGYRALAIVVWATSLVTDVWGLQRSLKSCQCVVTVLNGRGSKGQEPALKPAAFWEYGFHSMCNPALLYRVHTLQSIEQVFLKILADASHQASNETARLRTVQRTLTSLRIALSGQRSCLEWTKFWAWSLPPQKPNVGSTCL